MATNTTVLIVGAALAALLLAGMLAGVLNKTRTGPTDSRNAPGRAKRRQP